MSVFEVLASTDPQNNHAVIAVQERAREQFGAFLANAKNVSEFDSRSDVIAESLQLVASQVADEYGADAETLEKAAKSVLSGGHASGCTCGFCKNKGNLPGAKKDDDEGDSDSDKSDSDAGDSGDKDDDKDSGKPWEKDSSVIYARQIKSDFDWEGAGFDPKEAAKVCEECHHPIDKHQASGQGGKKGCDYCDCTREADGLEQTQAFGSVEKLAMAVTKKDFEAIASILQQNGADPQLAQQIADYFATQNQNFDNQRFMDAAGPYDDPQAQQAFAAVTAAIKLAAEPAETGDSYWSEKLDLGSTTNKDGVSDVGSPKIDKSKSGDQAGWDIPKIDVPSNKHETEEQNVVSPADYNAEDFDPKNKVTDRIDADTPLQPENNVADNTDTWSGTEGQASPVTSEVLSKFATLSKT